jgi:VanZ family protein
LNFRELLKAWLPVAVWMTLIFWGSTDLMSAEHTSRFFVPFLRWLNPDISPAALARAQFLLRKAGHITEYAILAALLFRGWRSLLGDSLSRTTAALLVAMLFAASDEFHQSFFASRTASLGDVLIDSSGALLGVMLCAAFASRKRNSEPGDGIV